MTTIFPDRLADGLAGLRGGSELRYPQVGRASSEHIRQAVEPCRSAAG